MKLSEAKIRAAKYTGGVIKLRDGNGLYVHVMASGKYFRYDYRYGRKRRTLSIGVWPGVTLKQARLELYAAKAKLDEGIDPSYDKQLKKQVGGDHSFHAIADQWMSIQDWSDDHRSTVKNRVYKDLIPKIGAMPVQKITAADVLGVLRIAEARGSIETAHRLKTAASQIMRYAISVGLINSDPCRDLRGALKSPKTTNYPAITDRQQFGKLLAMIDTYDQSHVVAMALRLSPYVALRPGELRGALWLEFDFNDRLWHIGSERMKKKRPHFVPLTDPMIEIIRSAREYSNGSVYLFPSPRASDRPISEGTVGAALKYLGYGGGRHVPHGFRSSFSTMAYESDLFAEDVIELQLAHLDKNRVKGAYKRGAHLEQRRELMQWWSDEIDSMRRSHSSHQSTR